MFSKWYTFFLKYENITKKCYYIFSYSKWDYSILRTYVLVIYRRQYKFEDSSFRLKRRLLGVRVLGQNNRLLGLFDTR